MEMKKQVPSITVTIRVPTHIHERMEEQLLEMKKRGLKVSKNSLFVEALSQFLDNTEEEQVNQDEEELRLQPENKVIADEIENTTESCSFCHRSYRDIKRDIDNDNIPDEVLLNRCCWQQICYVRARLGVTVDWAELCRRRGNLYRAR